MNTYSPENLQAMSDQQLTDAIVRAESILERTEDYMDYLESCSIMRRRELMPTNRQKAIGWRRNVVLARSEMARRDIKNN